MAYTGPVVRLKYHVNTVHTTFLLDIASGKWYDS